MANNPENLVPFTKDNVQIARKAGIKGGKQSGISKRRNKSLKELGQMMFSGKLSDEYYIKKIQVMYPHLDEEDITRKVAHLCAMDEIVMAKDKGSVQAFLAIRDSIGEKPVDKQEITGANGQSLNPLNINITPTKVIKDVSNTKKNKDKDND